MGIDLAWNRSDDRASSRLPSTQAPADHGDFDATAGLHAFPGAAAQATREGNDIGAVVVLAQELERLLRRRVPVVTESLDTLVTRHHGASTICPLPTRSVASARARRLSDRIGECF